MGWPSSLQPPYLYTHGWIWTITVLMCTPWQNHGVSVTLCGIYSLSVYVSWEKMIVARFHYAPASLEGILACCCCCVAFGVKHAMTSGKTMERKGKWQPASLQNNLPTCVCAWCNVLLIKLVNLVGPQGCPKGVRAFADELRSFLCVEKKSQTYQSRGVPFLQWWDIHVPTVSGLYHLMLWPPHIDG